MRKRLGRLALIVVLGLGGVIVAVGAWVSLAYSPTYLYRVLVLQESDQGDYLNSFPHRTLPASSRPLVYPVDLRPAVAAELEAALDVDDLDAFLSSSSSQALIVIRDGTIVLERYANGADRGAMLTSFSVAKSFDSTMVGIAIDEGFIASATDPITTYLPELLDREPRTAAITIADLLSMASGLQYEETRWAIFNGDDALTTYHPDQRAVSLEAATRIEGPPGELFRYNKYHPQLLGMILERTAGMSVTDYMASRLWEPIGMEYGGEWSLDSEEHGFEKMEAGLNARAVDFAKLGSLFLAGGDWNGSSIVSQAWIQASTAPTAERLRDGHYRDDFGRWIYQDGDGWYGFMWYSRARGESEFDFFAEGDHGQFIYVSPSAATVIVRLGTEYGIPGPDWIDAFYRFAAA